ncbi:hypothetical protein J4449_00145 [Candidatus Woesearchaeota archaeon]|nr:hypothetical protein [Candidatus Woesearchaeota archaeon]
MEYIGKELLKDPDADLTELLAREFEINFIRARDIARKVSLDDFVKNYNTLENLVIESIAKEIVKNGSFLDYKNSFLDEYFNLVRRAINKPNETKPSNVFYSLESLKKYLNNPNNGAHLDISKLNLSRNKLFSSDDEQAKFYLDSLIKSSYVLVSVNEHWSKSKDSEKGPRSFHILKKIAFLLKTAFADIGLERPEYSINNNTITLEIGEETRKNLQKIREELKSKQNHSVSKK